MALQVLIELVLGNVGKHFIVDLVCRAVGYPERQNEMSCLGHCGQGRSTNPSSDLPASAYPRASSSGAKQERQREHRSVTRLQCNLSQSRGVDAAGLSVKEAKSNSHSHGVNHVHHTQRQEGRENVSPCGRGQVREGKDSAVCQPGTTPDKRSASEERLGRFSLENKLARREKDLFSAYDLISRLKPGKEIDAWVPKKSCWKS